MIYSSSGIGFRGTHYMGKREKSKKKIDFDKKEIFHSGS